MLDLQQTDDNALRWTRPSRRKHEFELRAGEALVATLAWTGRARAFGQWAGGHYRFGFEGWFRPRVLVYADGGAAPTDPMATLMRRTGALTLADGRTFQWTKPARLTSDRDWLDAAGQRIMRFSPAKSTSDVAVTLSADARGRPEAPLLLLLGQSLLVIAEDDAIAATTVAVTTVIASS